MDAQAIQTRRAVSAAVIGNVLEWYDFAVYGYVATIIAKNFFPPGNETAALLATFATFGIGFLARPLSGIVIGWIGDKYGRKTALLATIFLMAVGTVIIGLIPTYASIGLLAPAILVIARLMQGFSAGGEWGGSTAFIVEWAPEGRRGYYGSFQQMSVVMGLLLGSGTAALLNTVLDPASMESWGWRIPFLLGGILGPVGIWMRRSIDETPAYRKAEAAPLAPADDFSSPVVLAARAFGFTILWTVSFYIFLAYMPTFTQKYANLSRAAALWSNTAGLLLLMIAIPVFGYLSDKYGRKPFLLACCLAFIFLPYPLFSIMLGGASLTTILLIQLLIGLTIALFSGAGPAAISEIFPTRTRSTYMSTGYALAVAIFGGFAPFIATWLIEWTKSPISPVYYVIASAIVSAIVIAGLRETAHEPLG
ncbi:MAG: MHS family MFS transporter [Alphaproteobacteria bacterium]|nr:MAG: MHS family MFS transporter [Alphaproteobacteria bacterium]